MNRNKETDVTLNHLNGQAPAGVADQEMETDKINPAAENLLPGETAGADSVGIEAESKGQPFASRIGRHRQSLSAILATLTAVSLVSLFFFAVNVTALFSGRRKSTVRRRRR